MTIKLEVIDGNFTVRNLTSRDGKPLEFREQEAWLHGASAYPVRVVLSLGRNAAYAPGFYRLDAGSFRVGRFGGLELARQLVLAPFQE